MKTQTDSDQRTRLLEVAAYLFRTRGYAATSIRAIARRLGMENASLYHYVRSKEELLFAISKESLKELTEKITPIVRSNLDPANKLREVIRTHIVSILEDRDKHTAMLFELKALSPHRRQRILAMRDEYEKLLGEAIGEAIGSGYLRSDLPSRYLELSLLNLMNWSIVWFQEGGELGPADLGDILATIFLEGTEKLP